MSDIDADAQRTDAGTATISRHQVALIPISLIAGGGRIAIPTPSE